MAEKSWRDRYRKVPTHVLDAVEAALRGTGTAFDALHRDPAAERQARDIYATLVREGHEPVNVSSSHSPRPAR